MKKLSRKESLKKVASIIGSSVLLIFGVCACSVSMEVWLGTIGIASALIGVSVLISTEDKQTAIKEIFGTHNYRTL